ncbi:hypothetical protein AMJ49_04770 [Parcubacteria bacterium DG_74_2]|nr:MAG: hypothetical protein AMJ49_04770 [Parcubacteria bacterium DG_74_2]
MNQIIRALLEIGIVAVILILLASTACIENSDANLESQELSKDSGQEKSSVTTTTTTLPYSSLTELERDKKEAEGIIIAFFEAAKKGEDIDKYVFIREDTVYHIAEKQDRRRFEDRVNRFKQYEKIKIIETAFGGTGGIRVKACEKQGLCEGFTLLFEQQKDGHWNLHRIEIEDIADFTYKKEAPKEEAVRIAKKVFTLAKQGKYSEVSDFFDNKIDRIDRLQKEKSIQTLKEISEYISFDKIEICDELFTERIYCIIILYNTNGASHKYLVTLEKKENKWKIYYIAYAGVSIPDKNW